MDSADSGYATAVKKSLNSDSSADSCADMFASFYELGADGGARGSAARFVCHLALARDGHIDYEAEGVVEGAIAPEPRGTHGFGYDPIFFYPPFNRTLGEVEQTEKATISHRGKAFQALRTYLLRGNIAEKR